MTGTLEVYTHQLTEARRRWNHHSLRFVLESARILRAAKTAAKERRRWVQWLQEGPHMSRATALKHLKVADFWNRNVSLRKHFAGLSLSKIYALARTKQIVARRLTTDETVRSMTDARFAKFIRVYLPKNHQPPSASNLFRSIMAGLQRAGCGISRWKGSGCAISGEYLRRIETRLKFLLAATLRGSQSRQRAL